jgi:hypothetical protein
MAERELLLSPHDDSDAVMLSQKVYRKRILPKATISYRGRKISFDDQYLTDLAQSFNDKAYDQVAFMLADTNNSHTLDPERFRGEVLGCEVGDDGLYATIQVTPAAAQVLKENPKLGVSARILENYQRSDGKQFPRALQHVLGTLDPVIPGLGTWEEVALSNGVAPENVIDLSATSYEELEHMATRADNLQRVAEATDMTVEALEALEMTDAELEIFSSAFASDEEPTATTDATGTTDADDELIEEPGQDALLTDDAPETAETAEVVDEPTEEEIAAAVEALSDEELEQLASELGITEDEAAEETTAEDEDEETSAEETSAEETTAEETTAEEVPAEITEPTDEELAERLGTGEFGSGLVEDSPDPDLTGFTDEDLLGSWEAELEAARSRDAAVATDAATDDDTDATDEAAEEPEPVTEPARELVGAGAVTLSNEAAPEVLALSNQVTVLQQQLAHQQFETLKKDYVRQGVPAALVELARPVLIAGPAATLELSNPAGGSTSVDAAAIVRKLLDSATGYIELARERGHNFPLTGEDRAASEAEEDKQLASLWSQQYNR